MQQHDIPELTPDEELDRTRVLPDPVDPLEGSARLPELRPEDEPGPEDEPEVPQKPKRRGRVVRKIVKYFLFLVLAVAIVAAAAISRSRNTARPMPRMHSAATSCARASSRAARPSAC